MNGKELWSKIFNTDFEDAILGVLELEKNFQDLGTDEENAEIVEALDGLTLMDMIDKRGIWEGTSICGSDIVDMFSQLDISTIHELEFDGERKNTGPSYKR